MIRSGTSEYDSTKMASLLERSHGLQRVSSPDEAQVLLMNTCSVREKAQEKLFSESSLKRAEHTTKMTVQTTGISIIPEVGDKIGQNEVIADASW